MFKTTVCNSTCPKCKYVFDYAISKGALASHVRLCRTVGTTLTLHAPNIPAHLTEVYHGELSEMPTDDVEYGDGPNPYELRQLLQSATEGEQEAVFEGVVFIMGNVAQQIIIC